MMDSANREWTNGGRARIEFEPGTEPTPGATTAAITWTSAHHELDRLLPKTSYQLKLESWRHFHAADEKSGFLEQENKSLSFGLFVCPGGAEEKWWVDGKSLEEILEKVRRRLQPTTAGAGDLDVIGVPIGSV